MCSKRVTTQKANWKSHKYIGTMVLGMASNHESRISPFLYIIIYLRQLLFECYYLYVYKYIYNTPYIDALYNYKCFASNRDGNAIMDEISSYMHDLIWFLYIAYLWEFTFCRVHNI